MFIPEKKIYRDSAGKLFIQKDLPVYLRISDSPADNGELLKNKKSRLHDNPFYLISEGYNVFRSPSAVDTVTKKVVQPKQDVFFEIYADSKPPVTTVTFRNGKVFKRKGKVFCNKNTELSFSAMDALSGVDRIMVSIDSAEFTEYTSPVIFNSEKSYFIQYYAYDHVGNIEKISNIRINADFTNPKTSLNIKGDQDENVLSGRSQIILNSGYDTSGIKQLFVKIDNKAEYAYSGPINASVLSTGDHKLTFYSVDNVGNVEDTQEFNFFVDKTPPMILKDIAGHSFMSNGKEYSSGSSVLKITALDNKAGIKEIYYSINNKPYNLYENPVDLSSVKGNMNAKVYALDKVNNRSETGTGSEKAKISYIDLSGPSLNHQITEPKFVTSDTLYICNKTKIQLNAFDSEAGIKNIQYRIDNSELLSYNDPFSILTDGLHSIEYIGTDNVENTSTTLFKVFVDNIGPAIYPRFSTGSKGIIKDNGHTIEMYPKHVSLFVAATDINAGYNNMTFKLNGSPERPFTGFLNGFSGRNKVIIKAVDKLGNETFMNIEFAIQN